MRSFPTLLAVLSTFGAVDALAKNGKNPQPTYQQKASSKPAVVREAEPSPELQKVAASPLPATPGSEWQQVKQVAEKISEKILNEKPADPIIIGGGPVPQPSAKDQDSVCNQTCRLFWEFVVVFLIVAKLFADKLRAKLVNEGKTKDFGEEKSRFDKTVSMMCKKTGLTSELNQASQMVEMVEKGPGPTAKSASMWGSVGNTKRWALLSGSQGGQEEQVPEEPAKSEPAGPATTQWKAHDKEQSKRELQVYQQEQQSLARKVAEMKEMLDALKEQAPEDCNPDSSAQEDAAKPMVVEKIAEPTPSNTAVSVLRASEMDLVDALCDMTDSEDEDDSAL